MRLPFSSPPSAKLIVPKLPNDPWRLAGDQVDDKVIDLLFPVHDQSGNDWTSLAIALEVGKK